MHADLVCPAGVNPQLKQRELAVARIDAFLDYIFRFANLVPFVLPQRPALRDPDDERILEVAVQCGALIITHNRKDFVGAEELRVMVKTPAEFLKMLRQDQ